MAAREALTRARGERRRAERAPRLVLRFAVLLALGLAGAAAVILVVVRHGDTAQAERSAIDRARFATEAIVKGSLRPADLRAPVAAPRRAVLDDALSHTLLDGTLRVTVYSPGGTATYSTDHRLIGRTAGERGRLREALGGQVVSSVQAVPPADGPATRVLVTYVPLVLGADRARGVVAYEQDYGPIAAAVKDAFLPIAAVLEVLLVLFFALFLPVLARVSWRIRRHIGELEHVATHDELTALPNRRGFHRALSSALAAPPSGRPTGVLVVDVDGFGEVNDALGHDAGDRLLVEMGRRLEGAVPDLTAVARLGADEFGVLLAGADTVEALRAAEEVRRALAAPLVIDGVRMSLDASVGVAAAERPDDGADGLLRCAGVALHQAKERRTGVEAYDPGDDARDASRLALIAELREAIPAGGLTVHYQPQSDIRTGVLSGVEALVRWQHPEHGLLPPSAFVPLAERAGLVAQLGRFVLGETVRQWREWSDRGIELDVSVNLTTVDLLDLALPGEVLRLLEEHRMPPRRLVLEITESTLMGDERRTLEVLERLRTIGVRVAIDDFGTGYSSLGYLSRLPVDEVKIDRSFVAGLPGDAGSASIVRLTIELARTFGLCVVAEGIETAEQLEHLAALGCDVAQGYLIGRPVPPAELAHRLGPARPGADDLPDVEPPATLPIRPGR